MSETTRNVLRVNSVEEQAAYRSAISRIIGNIMRDHDCTMVDIAENIDVSVGTVSNAFNKKASLDAIYLKRLGQRYGAHYATPYTALFGGRVNAIDNEDINPLPSLTASVHRIALAQSPESDGGTALTHRELLDMEADLRAAQRAIGHLLAKCGRLAA